MNIRKSAGIIQQTTGPYSPQQNGLAERMNRTITERARSMMNHMQVEKKWWAEAMNTAAYITNRVPCAAYPEKTPYEMCFGSKPCLAYLRVFGARGFAHIEKSRRMKLDKRAVKCMFLRCSDNMKGFRVWNFESQKIEITGSAQFQELAETKYVQVVIGDKSSEQNRNDCQCDEVSEQIPIRTIPHVESMDVDPTEASTNANKI